LDKLPKLVQGMRVKTFDGILEHQNPNCEKCGAHCFSLYSGGKKERLTAMYVCKNCQVIYLLPNQKKCEFTEVQPL